MPSSRRGYVVEIASGKKYAAMLNLVLQSTLIKTIKRHRSILKNEKIIYTLLLGAVISDIVWQFCQDIF